MGYRMIISDDEEMLIHLIRKLGHFTELDIEVVDECRDGEEALESILRNKPDFVVTDIQMPVLDGLEMIERVYQSNPDILFVLLSGYRYFEYAQSAVRLNVVDYLLKPVDEEQLNRVLERLCRLTDDRRRQEQDRATYREMCDMRRQERQQDFWQQVLQPDSRMNPSALQPETLEAQYEIVLPHRCVQMIFLNASFLQASDMVRLSIREDLEHYVKKAFPGVITYCQENPEGGFFVLLNFPAGKFQTVHNGIPLFYHDCSEQWNKYLNFPLTLGISRSCEIPAQFSQLAEEVRIATWGRLVLKFSPTIRYEQLLTMPHFSYSTVLTPARKQQLTDSLHHLKQPELKDVYLAMCASMEQWRSAFPGNILELFRELRGTVAASVSERHREELLSACDRAALEARDYRELLEKQYVALEQYILRQKQELENRNRKPVELALAYTRQNYFQDISLESTAAAAGLSPAYLSRVFKETTGMGFNEYLTETRLEESKDLLANSDLPVHEIARAVGYLDGKYYSKLFIKQFGIKPTEYRKLYGQRKR